MMTIEESMKRIGKNITIERRKKGFTQTVLAKQMQIPLELLRGMENGTMDYTIDILFQLAAVLNSGITCFFKNA